MQKSKGKIKKESGFTLIELLIVILIMSVLTSLGISTYNRSRARARDAKRKEDLRTIETALRAYLIDINAYPGNTDNDEGGWDTSWDVANGSNDNFIQDLVTQGYLTKVPRDPINNNKYRYRYYNYGNYENPGAATPYGYRLQAFMELPPYEGCVKHGGVDCPADANKWICRNP